MSSGIFLKELQKPLNKWWIVILFFYFATLGADCLGVKISIFHIRVNNAIAFIVLCAMLYKCRIITVNRSLFLALAITVFSVTISFIYSDYKFRAGGYLGFYLFTMLCYVLVAYIAMVSFPETIILKLYLFSFLFVGTYACMQFLVGLFGIRLPGVMQAISSRMVRASAFAYEPSYYALYMTPFITFMNSLFLLGYRGALFKKGMPIYLFVFVNIIFLVSTSTSIVVAYLGFIVFYAVNTYYFSYLNIRPIIQLPKLLLLICTMGISLFLLLSTLSKDLVAVMFKATPTSITKHHSFVDRFGGVRLYFNLAQQSLLHGFGEGAAPYKALEALLNPENIKLYLKNNSQTTDSVYKRIKSLEPTNVIIEIFSGLGMIGIVAFAFLFLAIILLFYEFVFNLGLPIRKKKIFIAFFISYITTLGVLQINQGLLRNYTWAHLGLMMGYYIKEKKKFEERQLYVTKL